MEMTAETKTQKPKSQLCVYEIRITLQEMRPPIWRLVQVPDTLPLSRLHDVLQTVIGAYPNMTKTKGLRSSTRAGPQSALS